MLKPNPIGEMPRGSSIPDSLFFQEWLAGNRPRDQLNVSAVCNSRCLFCSNHLNPFPVPRGFFRDLEDIKLQLSLMPDHSGPIRMSDSLPGRIAEGEAFLHPRFFAILELVRRKFPLNLLCFTTNASMLDASFLKALARFRPIEITVSMHSNRPELWSRIFGKEESDARRAIRSLGWIRKYGLELVGAIVPLPFLCGWKGIEATYDFFVSHGAKRMILWWPGHTVCTFPGIRNLIHCPIREFFDFAARMEQKHPLPVRPLPDLRGDLDLPIRKILGHTLRRNFPHRSVPYREVLWLTSVAAHRRIKRSIEEYARDLPNLHRVFPVPNRTYGGNMIVGGLLMVSDFLAAGERALHRWPQIDLILIPRTPFDELGRDLRGVPAYKIMEGLKRRVWWVDPGGEVESLLEDQQLRGWIPKGSDFDFRMLGRLMRRFNEGWLQGQRVDEALDLIQAFPVQTPWGLLNRQDLQREWEAERIRLARTSRPRVQKFEILDPRQALCIETWEIPSSWTTFQKWTFLRKTDSGWRIEKFIQGESAISP